MVKYKVGLYEVNMRLVWYQRLEEILDKGDNEFCFVLGMGGAPIMYNSPTFEDIKRDIGKQMNFHEEGTFSNGMKYGRLGSLTYILNENNLILTSGVHCIKHKTRNSYKARLGNHKYIITIKRLVKK